MCVADVPSDSEFVCDSAVQLLVHRLSVTLLNVMPAHQGEYLCKLHSTFGAKHSTTTVTVQGELYDVFICTRIVSFIDLKVLDLNRLPWKVWLLY